MPSTNLRPGSSEYNYAAAWLLYIAGDTLAGISEKMNIPYQSLTGFANRHNWKESRAEALDIAKKAVKEDLAKRVEKHKSKHQHFILDTLEKTQEKIEEMTYAPEVKVGEVLSLTRQHDDIARRTLKLDEDKTNNPVELGYALLRAMRGQQIMPSAISTLPDHQDANTGILRPFNSLENGREKEQETAIEGEYTMTGPKPMPKTINFQTPTRHDTSTSQATEEASGGDIRDGGPLIQGQPESTQPDLRSEQDREGVRTETADGQDTAVYLQHLVNERNHTGGEGLLPSRGSSPQEEAGGESGEPGQEDPSAGSV